MAYTLAATLCSYATERAQGFIRLTRRAVWLEAKRPLSREDTLHWPTALPLWSGSQLSGSIPRGLAATEANRTRKKDQLQTISFFVLSSYKFSYTSQFSAVMTVCKLCVWERGNVPSFYTTDVKKM
jgi:hypothetical protein